MAGITVDEVKQLLQIKTTAKDDYLNAVLPLVEDHVKEYCNRDFVNDDTGEVEYPGGVKLAIAKWCEFHMREAGIQSETLSRHSVTYAQGGMPPEVAAILSNYRRPTFIAMRGRRQ